MSVCLCMIVKDAGPGFNQVLMSNLPYFDEWCILDTGSTDGTQEVIKNVLKYKKGTLYEEPFVNFKVSRNRCLDLANTSSEYIMMLDDTYIIQGDLKSFLLENHEADSYSLMVKSHDVEYFSNRILKNKNLRYIYTIHEIIEPNLNVMIPNDRVWIIDTNSDYMTKRTNDRKLFDLKLLLEEYENNPDDPRSLYYIAQTYSCIDDYENKAKYFEMRVNHPQDGYIEEKVDAYFELARTYNFNLNKPWDLCLETYIKAYNLNPKRPDSLYFIGIHYYFEKDYEKAYYYFKRAYELGYPIDCQYSLKPTLSFHFVPYFLTEICYYMNDTIIGEESAIFFLKNNEPNTIVSNWLNIHRQMNKMGPLSSTPDKTHKIFCIVTDGGWEPWTGSDTLTRGLGGSETWVVETARWIKRNTDMAVVVFCNTEKSEFFEDVGYNPVSSFGVFVANNVIEYCVISRFSEYVPVAIRGHAQNIYFIFHDLVAQDTIIPVHDKIKCIYGLTDWHKNTIKSMFSQFPVKSIHYGVNKIVKKKKVKNSFIYSSFPDRGLLVLLRMWPRIIKSFPDATLHVYCNLDNKWVNQVAKEQMDEIKRTIKTEGVVNHSWVSKDVLYERWAQTEYWLYPCIFQETFCMTALEAAISRTFPITNNLAGLSETVGDRGLVIQGDPLTQEWQDSAFASLSEYMSGKPKDLKPNYKWAKEHTWENQANKFICSIV